MAFEGTLQDFTVNMHGPELEYACIDVQQGDTASRQVRIHLKDFGGADFQIPYGATAVFCINKSDGHKVYDACEIEDESTVIVTLSNQAIACAGRQKAQIYLSKDGWDIKTQTFTVNVPRAIYTDDAVKSSDEFGILSELIAEYEAIVDSAGKSAVSAADSAAAAEAARQGIEESLGQISENKDNITRSKEAIKDLSDKKITKFYASNLGETTMNDSDKGKIQDMILYGKSEQFSGEIELEDGTTVTVPNPDYPQEIKSVVNPKLEICGKNLVNKIIETAEVHGVTITNNGDGTYTLNGTNTSDWNAYDILKIKFNKNKTIRLTGGNGYARVTLWNTKYNKFAAESFGSNQNVTVTLDPFIEYSLGILITDLTTFDNVVIKPMISTVITDTYDDFEPYKGNKYTLPYTLNAIPVSSGGNVTIDGQEYIADYVDVERGKRVIVVDDSKLDPTVSITDNTDLLLYEPIEVDLTPEEVQMLRGLATNYPTTNVFVTSDQLDGYTEFNYPVSLAEGWNYIKQQLGDTRDYIYDMDLQSAEAYVNSEYAVALAELEV